ncbi:MAG: GNAT family N-acetyltransferase [Magnetococcales bacterium]|nr:GNAT family N-acetyltransferase [Magnetococcales bacterium]
MSIQVENMTPASSIEYEDLLVTDERSTIYSSLAYCNLLRTLSPDAECIQLAARDDTGNMRGGLTFFIKDGKFGPVANSLPFFGSPSSLFVPDNSIEVQDALIGRFRELLLARGCIASTFITSPLDPDPQRYRQLLKPNYIDSRIGMITPLPHGSENLTIDLMNTFRPTTRNKIRKGQKGNFRIEETENRANWGFLQLTHEENMAQLNAATRPPEFYYYLQRESSLIIKKRLYTVYLDNTPVAGLLLFLYNKTVEYFVPVIARAFRSLQPLSFLIMQAMQDAVASGYRWWSWGGTGLTQESLYHFKKGWGAIDHHYYYFVNVFDAKILAKDRQEIMKEYPFFFLYPFTQSSSSVNAIANPH